jgi:hypothetical protein
MPPGAEEFPSSGNLRQPIASTGRSYFIHSGFTCPKLLLRTVDENGISHLQLRGCVTFKDIIVAKRHLQRAFSTLWSLLHFFVTFFFFELTHLLPLVIGDTTRADVD